MRPTDCTFLTSFGHFFNRKGFATLTELNDEQGPEEMVPPLPLRSEFLFTLRGSVGSPIEVGVMPQGQRRIVPIEGGDFDR